ncbi:glycosyltransferase [Candidatus Saccharibacteria bacterium CPR2]|nr:glycosyltransferase [Candidatus Saccharibacteria bacterium CPR2]
MQKHPRLMKLVKIAIKPLKPLMRLFKKYYDKYKELLPDETYNSWATQNEEMCFVEKEQHFKPVVSIVCPAFNTDQFHLLEMVYSVVNQHYDNWELILVNASTNKRSKNNIDECAKIDNRIKVVDPGGNKGISGNTNYGIKHATGEYVAFLDHDDMLHPCAIHAVVDRLQSENKPEIIYTDEDKVNSDNTLYFEPNCKPGFSPDLLRNVNYINHLVVMKRTLLNQVGGLRAQCDGAQDYDLLLRAIDTKPENASINHISRVLYHWRAAETSTASDISTKTYIFKAGIKAISDHLERNNINAKVSSISNRPGWYKLIYEETPFSIIVGPVSRSNQTACALWLKDLIKSVKLSKIEIIIGNWYELHPDNIKNRAKVIYIEHNNSSEFWQLAAKKVTKPVAVCFKMAALPTMDTNGLSHLAAVAAGSKNTVVAPIIFSDDRTILDAGMVGSKYSPKHIFESYKFGKNTYFGSTEWVRNVSDLSTNIIATRHENFSSLLESSHNYARTNSLRAFTSSNNLEKNKINFVVWSHTPFKYKGVLKPCGEDHFHNVQLFKYTPTVTMHVDNWGEGYERAKD